MNLSLGELEALCRKAARGAGFDWGPAEEAGRAVRRLAAFGLPGAELLLVRLAAGEAEPEGTGAPRSLDGPWRSPAGALCPIHAGTALADAPERLEETARSEASGRGAEDRRSGELAMHEVIAPLLLVPFAGLAARRLGRPVSLAWSGLVAIADGEALRLDGERGRVGGERAGTVRCRLLPDGEAPAGEALARTTRAHPERGCVERLDAFAHRTYAPATEESRARGAGGAVADDG